MSKIKKQTKEIDYTYGGFVKNYQSFINIFGNYAGKIIGQNIIFILFSVLIFTMPAAFTASCKVSMEFSRCGRCYVKEEFIKSFKENFKNSLLLSVFTIIPTGLSLFSSFAFAFSNDSVMGQLIAMALLIFSLFIFVLTIYSYYLLACFNLKISIILKNSLILMSMFKLKTLQILLVAIILYAHVFLFPYSLPFILFISIAFSQLVISRIMLLPLSKLMK